MSWFKYAVVCILSYVVDGYLLDGGVTLEQHVPVLPQFSQNGKSMVLVGGNLWDNNTEIYDTIVRLAGGKGVAKMGIINAANTDPDDSYQFYRNLFIKFGVLEANRIPVDLNHTSNAADQTTIDIIYNQTGFFFGGGDQSRIIASFFGVYGDFSPALIALHQMFDSGAVIAGTSAGTTCQTANYMIKSGVSYESLLYGSFADLVPDQKHRDAMVYGSFGGLGFMKGYVLDSHFSQRGREGRMIRMLSDTRSMAKGTNYGVGIDENTALVVTHADTNVSRGEVIGESGVTVFDISKSHTAHDSYYRIADVYITYLTHGDSIYLNDRDVRFSSQKSPMSGHENYDDVLTTDDVFYGSSRNSQRKPEFVRIASSIFDSRHNKTTYGTTYEGRPRFRVDMSGTGHDAEGWVERKGTFHTDITSYKNLRISIYETN